MAARGYFGALAAEGGNDVARQAANVVGVALLVVLAAATANDVGDVANANRSLILPAGWAFAIWTPIFALSLAYAGYQALPARRADPLLRRIGWLTAGGLLGSAVWQALFAERWYVPAQLVIAAVFVAFSVALLRFVEATRRGEPNPFDRWLIAPWLGLYAGWITAATLVGFAATLVARGFDGDGLGAAVGGAALLLLGSAVAVLLLLAAKRGPAPAWVGYGAAFLWALAGVAANQANDSLLTTVAAAVAAVPVALVMLGRLPDRWPGRPAREAAA